MMKMRNFFSPFVSLSADNFAEHEIKLGITIYEQNRKRVFLLTTTDKRVQAAKFTSKTYAAFSSAYRRGEQCLVVEGSDRKAEAKIIPARTHVSFRASGCTFLPKDNHERREITAYLTQIGDEDQILVIPLPDYYRINQMSTIEKLAPQPYVENWPAFI